MVCPEIKSDINCKLNNMYGLGFDISNVIKCNSIITLYFDKLCMLHIFCLISKQISSISKQISFLSVCFELTQQVCQVTGVIVNLLNIYFSVYFKSIR